MTGPSEVGFENLSHVHTTGHPERVQDNLDRRSILEVWHVLFRQNARDHALVPVPSGHLVADAQLALHGDVNLHQLDDARRQFIALGQLLFLFVHDFLEHIDLARGHFLDLVDLLVHPRIFVGVLDPLQVARRDTLDRIAVQNRILGQQPLVGALVVQIGLHFLAPQQAFQAFQAFIGQNSDLVGKVLFELRDLVAFDRLGALVLLLAFAREDLHIHHDAFDSRRAVERSVAHVAGFFAEDRAQQFLFRRQLRLTLRRNLADDDVALLDAGADADHTRFVQISQRGFTHVRDVARHFLGTKLRVAGFEFELFDVNRGVVILLHHLFRNQNRVFEVVAAPRHERDQHVASQRQLAKVGAWTVGDYLPLHHPLAFLHNRFLVDAGVLVRALKFGELVNVAAHFARKLHRMMLALDPNNDAFGIDRIDDSVTARKYDRARVAGGNAFHPSPDNRSLSTQQRHRLTLHVRTHQRAVCVVVFQERHERSGHRNQLLRADVDVIHFVAVHQHKVASLASIHQLAGDTALVVQFDVGLRNGVPVFFPRGEIERKRLDLDRLLAPFLEIGVDLFHLAFFGIVADFVGAVTGIDDDDVVHHASVLHLAVGRLDEAVVVDARKAAQRRDQSDVRTFRGFNRADAPVVRWVDVANFESGTFARQAARPQGRQTPLVRDLRQRIRLIHELGQLRGSEELANRSHHRLRVDQVVRHGRRHFLVHAHLFLDRAFHADQTDTELVFQQLANRSHPAIAQVIDVIHRADVLAQLEQVLDRCVKVRRIKGALFEARCILVFEQLDVELQPAHAREVIFARIEEHALEQRRRRVQRRRITRPQFAINFDQSFRRSSDRIAAQGLADHRAHVVALGEEHAQFDHARFQYLCHFIGRDFRVRLEQHFTARGVDNVAGRPRAFQIGCIHFDFADLRLLNILQGRSADLAAGVRHFITRLRLDVVRQLHAQQIRGLFARRIQRPEQLLVADNQAIRGVESLQNVFAGTQAERAQKDRAQELALAVDAHVQNVLLVVLELNPRTAVGNDLSQEISAVRRRLEEHSRRTVQLADDDALGSIDDERAILRHQRNIAEENFLLLDVADGTVAGLILVPDGEPHRHFERSRVGHAALFAFRHVILQLQPNRIAALVAEVGSIRVVGAALVAQNFAGMKRVGNHRRSAILTSRAQVMQPFQVAALALPVANREVHKLKLGNVAEIGNRKHRLKYRLQPAVFAFAGQLVHLQEAVIGALLNLDQVRNLDGCWNFGKIETLAMDIVLCHS